MSPKYGRWNMRYRKICLSKPRSKQRISGLSSSGRWRGRLRQANRQARNIADDGRDGYLLLVNKGDTVLTGAQAGRKYQVGRGESALVSASEPLKMIGGDKNLWMNVVIPRAILTAAFPQIDDKLAITIDAQNEALSMLTRYCHMIETGEMLTSPSLIAHASETIVDLVGLTVGAKGDAAEMASFRGLPAARLQAVLREIARNFANPSITAQAVARDLKLSVRYVHMLLQETGVSFAERVLALRLQKTFEMLSDPHYDKLRISEIAMISGFSDVSYFNRCFRRRFGRAPGDLR